MNRRGIGTMFRVLGTSVLTAILIAGCSSDKLAPPSEQLTYRTLTVHYGDPGFSGSPCDDRLPIIDGIGTEAEWSSAEPLFVRVSGENGSGGPSGYIEVRAIWSDEGKFFGSESRIYFLVRYADDDDNAQPDILAYGTYGPDGLIDASPVPQFNAETNECDPVLFDPGSWTRVNPGGGEDQVLMVLAEDVDVNSTDLVAATRRMMIGGIGVETLREFSVPGADNLDVWIWRAGRTDAHPVPQFAKWDSYVPGQAEFTEGEVDAPVSTFVNFEVHAGFFEDFFVGSAVLQPDTGVPMFVKNFVNRDPIPDKITQIDRRRRTDDGGNGGFGGGGEDPTVINGDLSVDRVLWWPTARNFSVCDTVVTSRTSATKQIWSAGLRGDDFDKINGWAIQTPTGSARDVRGAGIPEELPNKGFSTRSVEMMRSLDTGNPDDVKIVPGKVYRLMIGIYDGSGSIGSGSVEIRMVFESETPALERPRRRC